MSTAIIKLEGLYLEWSSVSDAPLTFGMTLDELTRYYRDEYGLRGLGGLEERILRVERKGTSALDDADVDDTIWLNRAGIWLQDARGLVALSKPEIIEWYVRRKRKPTGDEIRAHRATLPKCEPCVASDGHGGGMRCACWGTGVREA